MGSPKSSRRQKNRPAPACARSVLSLVLGLVIVVICSINLFAATHHIHNSADGGVIVTLPTQLLHQQLQKNQQQAHHPSHPPLSHLVQGYNVTGPVAWLLQFSIVGFPKCGTSSLMYQLASHPQVGIFTDEVCDLAYHKASLLTGKLYNMTHKTNVAPPSASPPPKLLARGLKCPIDLESTALSLPAYHQYFYETKFVVGLRHPVLWFQSFYNFRVHNGVNMPDPNRLIGGCSKGMYNVCTFRGNFHLFLANLGKTNILSSPQEQELLAPKLRRSVKPVNDSALPGKGGRHVFLYDVSQLSSATRISKQEQHPPFLTDLQHFLGLTQPFPPHTHSNNNKDDNTKRSTTQVVWFKPGRNLTTNAAFQADERRARKMDICQDTYRHLRKVLMEQAVNASKWILTYFVAAPGVTVSNPKQFRRALWEWRKDPCSR